MSIDKFGKHSSKRYMSNNFDQSLLTKHVIETAEKITENFTKDVKLYYNIVLPFIGRYNEKANLYELLQDRRLLYEYPLEASIIVKAEYPKKEITLRINGKTISSSVGKALKKGDKISFYRPVWGTLNEFYGELLLKCPVEVEK